MMSPGRVSGSEGPSFKAHCADFASRCQGFRLVCEGAGLGFMCRTCRQVQGAQDNCDEMTLESTSRTRCQTSGILHTIRQRGTVDCDLSNTVPKTCRVYA